MVSGRPMAVPARGKVSQGGARLHRPGLPRMGRREKDSSLSAPSLRHNSCPALVALRPLLQGTCCLTGGTEPGSPARDQGSGLGIQAPTVSPNADVHLHTEDLGSSAVVVSVACRWLRSVPY